MTKEELRFDINEITRIFHSAKLYNIDFEYIHSIKYTYPIVYNTYYLFIGRIYHSVSVILILQLNKLFGKEEFSLFKLKNRMLNNYEKSELNDYLKVMDAEILFNSVCSEKIEPILIKLKKTRDKYYAHFDRKRPEFEDIVVNIKDTGFLIAITEKLLKTIELKYFDVDIDYNLSSNELGHNIFKRLNDWEKYREHYGYLLNKK